MSTVWPPPPDLESIQSLVRDADIEGLIEMHGAPADEYEPEADHIFASIKDWTTAALTVANLLPFLEAVWRKHFIDNDSGLALRRPALLRLAAEIARFFGPEAQPLTRQ